MSEKNLQKQSQPWDCKYLTTDAIDERIKLNNKIESENASFPEYGRTVIKWRDSTPRLRFLREQMIKTY